MSTSEERKRKALHRSLSDAMKACPGAEFVFVGVVRVGDQDLITSAASVSPERSMVLLKHALEDLATQPVNVLKRLP